MVVKLAASQGKMIDRFELGMETLEDEERLRHSPQITCVDKLKTKMKAKVEELLGDKACDKLEQHRLQEIYKWVK